MDSENPTHKSADIGEEDLVDYEEEDDTVVDKSLDPSKENENKYAPLQSYFTVPLAPSVIPPTH